MKKRNIMIIVGVIFLFVVMICLILYNQITTLAAYVNRLPQGQNAVNVMSDGEKNFLNEKLLKIETGMTEGDMIGILGTPYQYGTQIFNKKIDYWHCPQNDKECLIRIKIQDGTVHAIEWIKIDSFFWEKEFIG